MTMRLSIISLAGMVRTLVAVGTVRLRVHVGGERLRHAAQRGDHVLGAGRRVAGSTGCGAVTGASAGIGCGFGATEVVRATGCGADHGNAGR